MEAASSFARASIGFAVVFRHAIKGPCVSVMGSERQGSLAVSIAEVPALKGFIR
jgi:hypothetical protein